MSRRLESPRWRRFDWKGNLADITAMLAAGATGADVARRYGLHLSAALSGIKRHGLVIDAAATRAARTASCHRMNADPQTKRQRSIRQRARMNQPERMAANRAQMLALRAQPGFVAKALEASRTPEVCARRSEAANDMWKRRLAWLPPQFRPEYDRLIYSKGMTSKEAKAALARDIATFAATFEGTLWKVSLGQARVVENVSVPLRPTDTFALTGRHAV